MRRRLAAILAADVAGYSRMMGADEQRTLEHLKEVHRDVVQPRLRDHGGRTVKVMGDGLLAEFQSVNEAVSCALHIQDSLTEQESVVPEDQRIALRIGVSLGDIIVEGSDIYGNGVNVAARLEQIAEPGSIFISGIAYSTLSGDLRGAFIDDGEHELKNMSQPVHVWRTLSSGAGNGAGNGSGAVAITGSPVRSDRPTIAVVPFANLSSDLELDYLADGLAEDIITLLARVRGFLVIARYSTIAYRTNASDVRKIGRELGARYVIQGSIRPVGDELRITVQLIDARSGNHIWADRFDTDAEKLHALQDEVTARIVAHLQPELVRAEVELVERYRPKSLDAWTLYQKANTTLFVNGWNQDGFREAARIYRQATECDPEFALAHSALSLTLSIGHMLGFVADTKEAAAKAELALRLANQDSEVLGYAGCAIADLGNCDRAIDILEQAIDLNPSNAQAWVALGGAFLQKGGLDEAIANLAHGIRISPRDPRLAVWGSMLALALGAQGRIEEGIREARAACRWDRKLHNPLVVLAALLAKSGKASEALSALAGARQIRPDLNEREIIGLIGKNSAATLARLQDQSNPAPE